MTKFIYFEVAPEKDADEQQQIVVPISQIMRIERVWDDASDPPRVTLKGQGNFAGRVIEPTNLTFDALLALLEGPNL